MTWWPSGPYDTTNNTYGFHNTGWGRSYLHRLPAPVKNKEIERLRQGTLTSSEEYGYFWVAKSRDQNRESRDQHRRVFERTQDLHHEQNDGDINEENEEQNENPFESPEKLFFPKIHPKPPAVHQDAYNKSWKSPRKSETPRLPELRSSRGYESPFSRRIKHIQVVFEDDTSVMIPNFGDESRSDYGQFYRQNGSRYD